MLVVTLYTKPDCPLCDTLKADLMDLQPEIGFLLHEHNIMKRPADLERFRYLVPVLDIGDGMLLYPPHQYYTVRQALLDARDVSSAKNV